MINRLVVHRSEILPNHVTFNFSLPDPQQVLIAIEHYDLTWMGIEGRSFPKMLTIPGVPGRWARLDDEPDFIPRTVRYCRIDKPGMGLVWLYWRVNDLVRRWGSAIFYRVMLTALVWGWADFEPCVKPSMKHLKWPWKVSTK